MKKKKKTINIEVRRMLKQAGELSKRSSTFKLKSRLFGNQQRTFDIVCSLDECGVVHAGNRKFRHMKDSCLGTINQVGMISGDYGLPKRVKPKRIIIKLSRPEYDRAKGLRKSYLIPADSLQKLWNVCGKYALIKNKPKIFLTIND